MSGSDPFLLFVEGTATPVHVRAWSGREALSRTYRFDVVLLPDALADLEGDLLGTRATLCLALAGDEHRLITGVIARDTQHARHRKLRIVPALELLRLNRRRRIFQGKSVLAIVGEILREACVHVRWDVDGAYRDREYVVQYDESDLRFVERLLSDAGLAFRFEVEEGDDTKGETKVVERVVILDEPGAHYPDIGCPLVYRGRGDSTAREDELHAFQASRAPAPRGVRSEGFDYMRPLLALKATAGAIEGPSLVEHHVGADDRPEVHAQRARAVLRHAERRAHEAEGSSAFRRLAAGCRFELDHPDHPAGEWMVTEVRHTGRVAKGARLSYENHFSAVPASVFVPARPKRRPRAENDTAIVVGPGDTPLHTDALGRIKVQFHWDHRSLGDGKRTCWIRPAQAWAGAGHGSQFVPRVGEEVLVIFLDGDPDRPVVVGSVRNLLHLPPWPSTRTGILTQTLGGDGRNELSFEDSKGQEEIRVGAQRDLTVEARRHARLRVGGDAHVAVAGDVVAAVQGRHELAVGDASVVRVGSQALNVRGDVQADVGGAVDLRSSAVALRADGVAAIEAGELQLGALSGATVRIAGCFALVAGRRDAPAGLALHAEGAARISAAQVLELASDGAIELRVGASMLRLSDAGIELFGPSVRIGTPASEVLLGPQGIDVQALAGHVHMVAQEVALRGSNSRLVLRDDAQLDGETIRLNSPPTPDPAPPWEPPTPTTLQLTDDHGTPLPGQPFEIREGANSVRVGVLDREGSATLALEPGPALTVAFPGVRIAGAVAPPSTASSSTAKGQRARPVRAGEHLHGIAHELGVTPEAIWDHPANAKLRAQRENPNVLAEGDILYVPAPGPTPTVPLVRGQVNKYVGSVPTTRTHLRLADASGRPHAGEPYEVRGLPGPVQTGTTDDGGGLVVEAPVTVKTATVELTRLGLSLRVGLGEMDPASTISGAQQRLAGLGYFAGAADGRASDALTAAITRFKEDRGMLPPATGMLDDAVAKALADGFGC